MLEIEYAEYFCRDTKHKFHVDGDRVIRLFLQYDNPGNLPDLSNFPNLIGIHLKGFSLKEMPEDYFISNTELNLIYIDWTYITELLEKLFRSQGKLKQLNISSAGFKHPKISSLPPKIFYPLINLESISLGNMPLESIDDDIFKMNSRLKTLSLGHVKFNRLPRSILALDKLETLALPFDPVSFMVNPSLVNHGGGAYQKNARKVISAIRKNEELASQSSKIYDKCVIEIMGKIKGVNKLTVIKFLSYFYVRIGFEIEFTPEGINFIIPDYLEVKLDSSLFDSYSVDYFHRVKFHGHSCLSIIQRMWSEFEIHIYKEEQGHLTIEIDDEQFVFETTAYETENTEPSTIPFGLSSFDLVLDKEILYEELSSLLTIGSGWLRLRYNFEKEWLTLIGKLGEWNKWKYYLSSHNPVKDVDILDRGKFPKEIKELDLPIGLLQSLEEIQCEEIELQVRGTRVRFYYKSVKYSIDFRLHASPDFNRHIKENYPILPVNEFADDIKDIYMKRPDVPLMNNLSYLSIEEILGTIDNKGALGKYWAIDKFLEDYPLTLSREQKIAILEQVNTVKGKCKKCKLKYRFNWQLCIYCQIKCGRESKMLADDHHIRAGESDRLLMLSWGRGADDVDTCYIMYFWEITAENDPLNLREFGQGLYFFTK